MRIIAKFFLWLITVAIPVVIAACYGPLYKYSKSGKVVDSETQEGINGIQVSCMVGGSPWDVTYSDPQGEFLLMYDRPCDELQLEDVDGDQNGRYLTTTAPFCEDCTTIAVEMDPEI
jgi:hypothetical protein